MAATAINNSNFDTSLYLSPKEQDLLLSALSSGKPSMANSHRSNLASARPNGTRSNSTPQHLQKSTTRTSLGNNDFFPSPTQQTPGSATFGSIGFDDSPFLDYDLDDGNFDWDTNGEQMIGALPGSSLDADDDSEHHDKRKSPEDDPDEEDGGGKRREGDDKLSKKPGRKPLTSEPTSKRKAQNRAAQRAFRERKERHLKELETKVEDLEKASESANHENGILRAQVDRLQSEVKEYRKSLSVNPTPVNRSPPLQSKSNWDINSNFQFEFPKFGESTSSKAGALKRSSTAVTSYNGSNGLNEFASTAGNHRTFSESSKSKSSTDINKSINNKFEDLAGLFSPSILGSISSGSSSDYLYNTGNVSQNNSNNSDTSNSTNGQKLRANTLSSASECNTASPSVSSVSQNGFNSSCGTSPEPSAASPEARKASEGTMDVNGDGSRRPSEGETAFCNLLSTACGTIESPIPLAMSSSNTPSSATMYPNLGDFNGIEWMAQQNGGNFDPVLFGDYRDPQETIMSADFGDFFNDAFPITDFTNSSNMNVAPITNTMLEPTLPPKKDLMQQIEDSQSGKEPEIVPGEQKQFLTCNMLWDRVTKSARVQSGEADMDDLCTQLKSKAKCSGSGAVIDQKDVDAILGPAPREQQDFLKMFK